MGAFSEINEIVKSAAFFDKKVVAKKPSRKEIPRHNVGSASNPNNSDGIRIGEQDIKKILNNGDVSGSKSEFNLDNDGFAWISPIQARINAYRDAFKLVKGDSYRQEEADATAMKDMESAQRSRHSYLKKFLLGKGVHIPKYDSSLNYTVAPHRTFIPGVYKNNKGQTFRTDEYMSTDFGRRDRLIPFYDAQGVSSKTAIGFLRRIDGNARRAVGRGTNNMISIRMGPSARKYVMQHEGDHSVAPYYYSTGSQGDVSFMKRPSVKVKGKSPVYALDPSEALVATLSEKTRLRAEGHSETKGLGKIWAEDVVRNGDKMTDGLREFDLNVRSLRHILKNLYEKANSKDATQEDKKNYNDFIDQMDYYFEVADNGRSRSHRNKGVIA